MYTFFKLEKGVLFGTVVVWFLPQKALPFVHTVLLGAPLRGLIGFDMFTFGHTQLPNESKKALLARFHCT